MLRQQRAGPVHDIGRGVVDQQVLVVQDDHVRRQVGGQPPGLRAHRQQHGRGCVAEQEADAVDRLHRVDRQVCGPGLEHAEHCGDELGPTREQQCHHGSRPQTAIDQVMCQPVRRLVQRGVRQFLPTADHRGGVRCAARLSLEELGNRGTEVGDITGALATPLEARQLGVAEQPHGTDRDVGGLRDQREEPQHLVRQRLDGREVQRVRPVVEVKPQRAARSDDERQRVVRRVAAARHDAGDGEPALHDGSTRRVVLERAQRVEQLAAALAVVEPEVLVRQEGGLLRLQALQQAEQLLARVQRDAQRYGVDEHADHRLDAVELRWPAGHRDTGDDVVAAGEAAEHETPDALHDGVQRQPVHTRPPRKGACVLLG
ncbi:hypothetical protein GCM10010185_54920 [Saccharothrix coeruleofusca]|uniref:Uncharacterized protein n=1 Tax=Saccharothrix coeruleofusca TaxID=33919 RepID=A0A918ARV5_9PSEU|nr:hypothetical protein GCM10010185_54920 [Saccharothrix coeruleofusca]